MLSLTPFNTLHNSLYSPVINPYAQLLFSSQTMKDWKLVHVPIFKQKLVSNGVSVKQDILQWFKKLSLEEKIAAISIQNDQFIKNFLRFSAQQYENKLLNFNTGYSILNILSGEEGIDRLRRFNKVKDSLRFALMEQEVMYLQLVSGTMGKVNPNLNQQQQSSLCADQLIEWLQSITQGKCFQMAHKLLNKQSPEDNILWFCSESFSTLQTFLANEIEKSITKNYFKKQTLLNHKLHQFSSYISKKHPQHMFLLRLSLLQITRMTLQQKQHYCSTMKTFQHVYYEDVRMSFIQSIQNLQKKKKKQKRKVYKRKQCSDTVNNNDDQQTITNIETKIQLEATKIEGGKLLGQGIIITEETNCSIKKQTQQVSQAQHIIQQTHLVDNNISHDQQQNQPQPVTPSPLISNPPSKLSGTQYQTPSLIHKSTSTTQHSIKTKNIVYSRERQRSPYSKSNIVDNECSKSQLSGEIYQTYTQCLRQDDYDQNDQKHQLFEIDGHPLQINDSPHINNNTIQSVINNTSISNNQLLPDHLQSQNDRLKKRRKRKNNSNTNNPTNNNLSQSLSVNNQLTNKIKSYCQKSYTSNLTHFIDHLSIQTNNLYQSKIVVFERIRYFIKAFYPQSEIMLFGSNSIGLSLATSDVDVMVLNINCTRKQEVKEILAQIAIEINVMAWVVSCSTYLGAKTPLVKLQIDPLISYYETKRKSDYCIYHPQLHQYLDIKDRKKAKNISLDLTISLEPTPYSPSTQLMRSYLNNNPLLQRIILIIKYILTTKAYNKNFSGGLGSYCLFIMITAYFQQHQSCMHKDQGEVLLDVLKFYSEQFQNLVTSITLRDNASCFISLEESLTMANFSENILSNPLRIIDPLTQKLTSSSCSQYHLIKIEFRRIRTQILAHLESIYNQVQPNFTSKSTKTDGLLDKNIQKMVHKSEAKRKGWLKRVIQGKNQTR